MAKRTKSVKASKSDSALVAIAEAKVNKSAAIREYLKSNGDAKPKEIVAALAEKGITVSPNMVSIVKAKTKVKSARRQATKSADNGEKSAPRADGLDAALVLYQAVQGRIIPSVRIRKAFLTLVELHG